MGFDRSMILGYGHDDRVCAYAAFRALLGAGTPPRTAVCILADQEEIGSRGSTSAQSAFVRFFMEETAEKCGAGPAALRAACDRSRAISADVDSVLDPNFKDVHDPLNAARLGRGVVLSKTSGARGKAGSTEATAEYLAWIRRAFDDAGVAWQTGEIGKVEQGGGGTVATYFALMNIDTLDCGTGVLSMHAPFEIVSKADVYSTMRAYAAFLAAGRGEKA